MCVALWFLLHSEYRGEHAAIDQSTPLVPKITIQKTKIPPTGVAQGREHRGGGRAAAAAGRVPGPDQAPHAGAGGKREGLGEALMVWLW